MIPYSICIVITWAVVVRGGGMLMDPVNRGSLWRAGYDISPDYDDELQNCGEIQSNEKIKCGECGDNPNQKRPRDHENTGQYGSGIIVGKYNTGQIIEAKVVLASNNLGYFSFDLCPLKHSEELETEECFKAHPILLDDGSSKYSLTSNTPGEILVKLKLPENVTCEQCVLRWTYRTGKTLGLCTNGIEALGCGPQQHLRTCSDISIL